MREKMETIKLVLEILLNVAVALALMIVFALCFLVVAAIIGVP